jgi:ubiquinone/menaquinone biosynthesis C-methylase UbiE
MRRKETSLATTDEWQALARLDPFYVVAWWPGKQGKWTPEEFYALGRSDWADAERQWRHYSSLLGGTCVEIGCGAGRTTAALATSFERVIGFDVSPDMLALARKASPQNVELVQVDGTEIPLPSDEADAVFTAHVLQHLDNLTAVANYVREMYRVLKPGGTLMLHVALRSEKDSKLRDARNFVRLSLSRRALARGRHMFFVRVRFYRPEEIRALLQEVGFTDIELREFPMRSNNEPHPFWFSRKAGGAR